MNNLILSIDQGTSGTKAVIFAPVHHMFSAEPFPGEIDVKKSVKKSIAGQATAIVISKGFLKLSASVWKGGVGVLNCPCTYAALSPKPIQQVTISSVEETFRLGADGVCVFVGLATENDPYGRGPCPAKNDDAHAGNIYGHVY